MQPTQHDPRRAGFTIVEMTVAATVLLALTMMVTELVLSGQSAHRYSSRLGRITDVSHRVLDDVKRDLRGAVRIFGDDALGSAYRSRLEPWLGFDPIRSSRLPTISVNGTFNKDVPSAPKTGNELLFARHAWSDAFLCSSGTKYRIDIYRLVRVFLKVEGSGPGFGSGALNICKWTSEPLANAAQIDQIASSSDRVEVLVHLLTSSLDVDGQEHNAVSVVWKFGEDPATTGTLRHIQADGSLTDDPKAPRSTSWQFEQAPHLSDPGMLYPQHHSIAANTSPTNHGVGRFGIIDPSAGLGAGFPHGLEFQVIGRPTARQVLVHLTTISTNRKGSKAHFDVQVIMNVREG